MRNGRGWNLTAGFAFAAATFGVLWASAFADVSKANPKPPPPTIAPPVIRPITVPVTSALPTMPPPQLVTGLYTKGAPPGTKLPLWKFPPLPMKNAFNTVTPRDTLHGRHFRPFGAQVMNAPRRGRRPHAATGATIEFWATAASCTSAGTIGALYNVGCALTWQPVNLDQVSATDSMEEWYMTPNSTTLTSIGPPCGAPAAGNGSIAPQTTTLSTTGTYMFGVYDCSTSEWVAVAYANAGQTFNIKVFQDPFHLTESYQFDVSSSSNAYIYLTNVSQADYYVTTVTYTGDHPFCAFISPLGTQTPIPAPTPTGTAQNLLCSISTSTGNQAPGGNLPVTWPLSNTLPAGTYSIQVFDKTINQNLGQVQVSLTGSSGDVLILTPSAVGTNPPPPSAAPGGSAQTIFDWDGPTDQSDGGVTASASKLTSGHAYTWTLNDPQGQVVATATPGAIAGTTATNTFNFAYTAMYNQGTMNPPGQYPSKVWTVQLYDRTAKSVTASQSFNILGYSTSTSFNFPAGSGTSVSSIATANGSNTVADLVITNTSNTVYNFQGDSLSEIGFSTGPNFGCFPPFGNGGGTCSTSAGQGNSVYVFPNGGNPANCVQPATCSISAVDSNGNGWTGTDMCNSVTNSHAECNIDFKPNSSNVTLPPGATLTASSLNFSNSSGSSSCGNACQGLTIELPTNGLSWSSSTATVAWTPVYFTENSANTGTVRFGIVGSVNAGTRNPGAAPTSNPIPTPFVGTHWYQDRFTHADYQNNTPFTVGNTHFSIWGLTITNAAGSVPIDTIAIQLPPLLQAQGISQADGTFSPGWSLVTCPTGYSSQWACFHNAAGIAAGATQTVYFDQTFPLQSFPFTELVVQGIQTTVSPNVVFNLSAQPCAPVSYCTSIDGATILSDSLGIGAYSLNGNLMAANFSPSTVGSAANPTNVSVVVQNTSLSADPNPDPIDAIVIEQQQTRAWTVNTSSTSNAGWALLGSGNSSTSGTAYEYWFGPSGCAGQFVQADGPPTTAGNPNPPTGTVTALPVCTTAQEANALQPGQSITLNLGLNTTGGIPAGTYSFNMYAHGANGNGWSSAKPFTLTVNSTSATAAITKINTTAFSNPAIPTIASPSPQTVTYEVANNSATSISTVVITLPGKDINNINSTDSSGQTWTLVAPISSTITIPSNPGGCTVDTNASDTFSASTSGANGQITIKNCTGLTNGQHLDVQFQVNNPSSQSDEYIFPATLNPAVIAPLSGGSTAGALYLGSNYIAVNFSIGLSLTVNPTNPTTGGGHPSVSCTPAQCAFSGTTIDFGAIGNSSNVTGNDVVLASVVYSGGAGTTWTLSVSSNVNPACTGCAPANEMVTDVDSTASGSLSANGNTGPNTCWDATHTVTYNQTSLASVPTVGTLLLATGPEKNCTKPYDVINNYKIQIGTESINGQIATVTYTLIAN
jgi:hypothetical protein